MASYDSPFDDYGNLLQLVEFAIRNEEEAAAFYAGLAARASSEGAAAEFRHLGEMEEGHRLMLQRLNVAEAASGGPRGTGKISASDYAVETVPRPDMSKEELLDLAIGKEIAAVRLYSDMANMLPGSSLQQLLLKLASEEEQHREYLEGLKGSGF